MKTNGQLLYEHQHPELVRVVLYSDTFRLNPFWVKSPAEPTPWRFITKECQATYEAQAKGHYLFSKAPA